VYRRLAPYKDAPPPTVEEAVGALLRGAVSTGIES
jgi:hypothetical protein